MKTSHTIITSLTVGSTLLFATAMAHAQGSLTAPVGSPAPVMKSLDQIEARTPIVAGAPGVNMNSSTAVFQITKPGSYYLTGNVIVTNAAKSGIDLNVQDVTLDLNGFSIIKTTTNLPYETTYAISLAASDGQTVVIRNGHISGTDTNTGFTFAIDGALNSGNIVVEDLVVSDMPGGISLNMSGNSTVNNCSVRRVGKPGIAASIVKNCRVVDCMGDGIIGTVVSDCYVNLNNAGNGRGIYANSGSVMNCFSQAAGGYGIDAGNVSNSYGGSTSASGIRAWGTASFCRGSCPGGVAIWAGIAIGCTVSSGSVSSAQKHLGTP